MRRIVFGVMLILLFMGILAHTSQLTKSESIKAALPTDWPQVYFTNGTANSYDESFIGNINDTITVALVVFNLTDNIYVDPANPLVPYPLGNVNGFDIQMSWDPTILKYVNHTVTVPVEDYPSPISPSPYAGILHEEVFEIKNKVDETGNIPGAETNDTMAWFAYSTMPGTEVFNGNGTFFTMTFNVAKAGSSSLKLTNAIMSGDMGEPVAKPVKCHTFDGIFRTVGAPVANFTFWPDVGVIDKPVVFNASASYSPFGVIANYTWNFGDGNITAVNDPIISHNYTTAATRTVSLTVVDFDGVSSSPKTEQVAVVNKRNLKIADVSPSAEYILAGKAVDIAVRVENDGDADENFTLAAYYNATSVNWTDISTTSWIKINQSNVFLSKYSFSIKLFTWNTTGVPKVNARYYILANATQVPYEDINDNNMIGDSVFIVSIRFHDIAIEKLEIGWGGDFEQPVLDGEDVKFQITVLNNGTVDETAVNVTLYCDDSMLESWNESIQYGATVKLTFQESFDPGSYTIAVQATIENDSYLDNNFMEKTLKVIRVPKLNITYAPDCPLANYTVSFNASASFHQEPGASITQYRWQIYNPEVILVKSTYGADLVNITYKLGEEGEWRVVLSVKDNYNIEYNMQRPATSAYRIQATINIEEGLTYSFEAYTSNSITYYVNVTSNSTITGFHFNPNVGPSIEFNAAGTMGTGSCQVAIPQSLLWVDHGDWEVLVGGEPVDYTVIQDGNTTYLCFTYSHSTKTVQIIGTQAISEFPSAIILTLFMVFTMLAAVFKKKRAPRGSRPKSRNVVEC